MNVFIAYKLGYLDGLDCNGELASGLTWDNNIMNYAYDTGVNNGITASLALN
jgi:hypothetical protein